MQKRILVAEDNKFTAMQYEKLLESNNHLVDIAIDGDECVRKYTESIDTSSNKSSYDVILLDHSMPKRTGAEVAGDILSFNPDQKIILASAYAISTEKNYSKLKDKIDFLQKPFELTQILDLV